MSDIIIEAKGLSKTYGTGKVKTRVLRNLNLEVHRGEFLVIVGPSGSGKSTLLHLLGLLDVPTSGQVYFEGEDAFKRSRSWRERHRNRDIGFVFQFYHLLPELTVLQNTVMPAMIGVPALGWFAARGPARKAAEDILRQVGLQDRMSYRPLKLSGGERQRAAIARALAMGPRVLFADEPTGNLDSQTGREVFEILRRLNREREVTVVMVTHDEHFAADADRVVGLKDGKITDEMTR